MFDKYSTGSPIVGLRDRKTPDVGSETDTRHESSIGKETPQVNAPTKVSGRAQYAGDIQLPRMLYGKVLRSPHAHARIKRIDMSAARALPGVKAVLTGADAPDTMWGVKHKERHILAKGIVRFAGEEVVAVAATSEKIALDALELVKVDYEPLPALLTPEESLAANAEGVHPGRDNVAHKIDFERGSVDVGFGKADLIHEETYTTSAQYQGYLEPMASVAHVDADGRLEMWTSTQSAFMAQQRLAAALELPVSRVHLIQATTGGGFGGKIIEDANQLIAGLLALKTDRPVQLVNSRLDDFQACCTSVPERMTLKLGMTKDGRIVAKEVNIVADCGAYCGLTHEVMHITAMRSDNMHRLTNVRSHARLAYTHTPPHGAFRGFGGSQMLFALNSHIDTMAEMLGLDPVEVHRVNAIQAGDTSIHGWEIGSTGLDECLEQCTAAIDWEAKRVRPKSTGVYRRGVGMAAAMHVSGNRTIGNWDGATVMIKVNTDGRVIIHNGEADMGQGTMTMLSQIVANELSIPITHVQVVQPDTDSSPYGLGSFASRSTMSAGNAAILSARKAKNQLLEVAADYFQCGKDELELTAGEVRRKEDPDTSADLGLLATKHLWRHGGEGIQTLATWDPNTVMHDEDLYGNVAPAHSFAAQAVEVEVDTETGQVRVLDSYLADDCGKALNPIAVHGQSNGAVVQAIGWTLYEDLRVEDGRITNGNFADYTMPVAGAVPKIRSGIVESNDPNGPYGAKGSSECAILTGAGAIANAIYDAVGVRMTNLCITPEKVLAALEAKKEADHA